MSDMKVYLAGKVAGFRGSCDWRNDLMTKDINDVPGNHPLAPGIDGSYGPTPYVTTWSLRVDEIHEFGFPIIPKAVLNQFDYTGPYFIDVNGGHGNPADEGTHKLLEYDVGANHELAVGDEASKHFVTNLCFNAIERSDIVFVWVSSLDIYATLIEAGYAKALGKQLWVGISYAVGLYTQVETGYDHDNDEPVISQTNHSDLWFLETIADRIAWSDSATGAFRGCIPDELSLATMPYAQYLKTDHWQAVRKAALERADHRCQTCNTPDNLHVHHRTYENRGSERDSDVIVLCKECHERFHGVTNGRVTHTVR